MEILEFKEYLKLEKVPSHFSEPLAGLWYDAKGNWQKAHEAVQDDSSSESAWVHAYLHRKEGDLSNAKYWYRRASKKVCNEPLGQEWEELVRSLS